MNNKSSLPIQVLSAKADARIQRRLVTEQVKERFWHAVYVYFLKPTMSLALLGLVAYTGGIAGLEYVDESVEIVPGDVLYSLKRGREIDQLAQMQKVEDRSAYYIVLANKRVAEVRTLLVPEASTMAFVNVAYADVGVPTAVYFLLEESADFLESATAMIALVEDPVVQKRLYVENVNTLVAQKNVLRAVVKKSIATDVLAETNAQWTANFVALYDTPVVKEYVLAQTELAYDKKTKEDILLETALQALFAEPEVVAIVVERKALEQIVEEEEGIEVPEEILEVKTGTVVVPIVEPEPEIEEEQKKDDFFEYQMDPEVIERDNKVL
jgi:hypothetical protein